MGFLIVASSLEEAQQHIEYMPGLEALVTLVGLYLEECVRVFYSTIWIDPDHEFKQIMFKGEFLYAFDSRDFGYFQLCSVRD